MSVRRYIHKLDKQAKRVGRFCTDRTGDIIYKEHKCG